MDIEKARASKRKYGNKYNKQNINVQLNRNLINHLKSILINRNISLKSYIESLVEQSISNL